MTRKRFTDTDKWHDPWFQELPLVYKALFMYLCDRCDAAGVWEVNETRAVFDLGIEGLDIDNALEAFGDRVAILPGGHRWHLTRFIDFQYPKGLSPQCPPHQRIIKLINRHGLRYCRQTVAATVATTVATTVVEEEEEVDKEVDVFSNAREAMPPVAIVQNVRPPVSDLDHVANAGGWIGRDERGAWQLLVDERGLEAVCAACRKVVASGAKAFRSAVSASLGVAQTVLPQYVELADGRRLPVRKGSP